MQTYMGQKSTQAVMTTEACRKYEEKAFKAAYQRPERLGAAEEVDRN